MSVYILAEVGSTHDGSLGNALRMIEVFAGLGADAIKFQCHFGQQVAPSAPTPAFFRDEGRASYFKRTGFTPQQWAWIRFRCISNKVNFVPSVFSVEAVEMLEGYAQPDAYKLPSGQLTNTELRDALLATGRTVYYSLGMVRECEIPPTPMKRWIPMACTSEYPVRPEHAWLVDECVSQTGPWGLSDHSMGLALSIAAVSRGACAIERHVCFSRHQYGSDAKHSLEPEEFGQLVKEIRWLEKAMASTVTRDQLMATEPMQQMRKVFLHGE
jgi:N-acetylneuraminate synthase